jgi:hypothetical protein
MKRAVGIDFTEAMVRELQDRGFRFLEVGDSSAHGFRKCLFPLRDSRGLFDGFEIHIVAEELDYLAFQKIAHFFPFVDSNAETFDRPFKGHPNSVEGFRRLLTADQIDNQSVREYLQIRKSFPIFALELSCRDWGAFLEFGKPDRVFKLHEQEAGLIHLGPCCFDIIVTEHKAS